jgi:hypothetical protein
MSETCIERLDARLAGIEQAIIRIEARLEATCRILRPDPI